jgi:NAD(P)-dependent dehydrogenase (short-subunit alcohol dehydrogenase family)
VRRINVLGAEGIDGSRLRRDDRCLTEEVTRMAGTYAGKVVVITGGGRGIGRATALEFAAEGATLVLAGRRLPALRTAAGEVAEAGGKANVVPCDVVVDEQLVGLVDKTIKLHGKIDVLVNNAGVMSTGRLEEIAPDEIRRIVDVNVWAVMRLTQLALPHMRAAKSGAIVNISSLAGRMGMPYFAAYSASKFAIRGFSEALRRELRPEGIRVFGVYPGGVATDMIENIEFERLGLGVATAEQVARAILRGLRWNTPDVFVGIADPFVSAWNDMLPLTVDFGLDFIRNRVRETAGRRSAT